MHQHRFTYEEIIEGLKTNSEAVLNYLYQSNYYRVESFVVNNNGDTSSAKDVFQDALVATWRNIKQNKFSADNEGALHGYILQIAKNKWRDFLRSASYKRKAMSVSNDDDPQNYLMVTEEEEVEEKESKLELIEKAMGALDKNCIALLKAFYFEKKSIVEIADELSLEPTSAKNKKYRCMQRLRELVFKSNSGHE